MQAKQVFHLAVRLLGLWLVFLAFRNLPAIMATFDTRVALREILTTLFYLVGAWWFLLGGPLPAFFRAKDLTALAYKEPVA